MTKCKIYNKTNPPKKLKNRCCWWRKIKSLCSQWKLCVCHFIYQIFLEAKFFVCKMALLKVYSLRYFVKSLVPMLILRLEKVFLLSSFTFENFRCLSNSFIMCNSIFINGFMQEIAGFALTYVHRNILESIHYQQ